jgi:hypothetical protein
MPFDLEREIAKLPSLRGGRDPKPPVWRQLEISSRETHLVLLLYWTEAYRPQHFVGRADEVDAKLQKRVVAALKAGEVLVSYRGPSTCRICHRLLGSADLTDGTHVWPSRAEHYLIEHQVWVPGLENLVG